MQTLEDRQLVLLVQATGEIKAYEELVRRHQPALHAFMVSLGAESTADEVVQRALLKAYDKIDRFEHRSSFKTWLFKIAFREHAQILRRQRSRPSTVHLDDAEAHDVEGATDAIDDRLDLEAALATLPELERAAVLLCDGYGMSNTEAADALAKPLGTVKTYVRRARATLRRALTLKDEP